ncbi:MAG: hypothetical protein MUE66_10340 [Acidimicrobiia bacterium]|nr:hypothetical protein [Acidimicrobiia bacterium]
MGKSRSGRRVRWLVVALLTAIAGLVTGFAGASALSGSVSPASAGDAVVQAPSGCSTTWDAVAYWCFDDQVSPTDDGAGSHNATVVGAAFATSSLPPVPTSRAALVFDGSNDYAWTPDPNGAGNLDGFSQMTLAAWVKPDKVSGVHMIVSKYNHSVAVSYWLLLRGDEIEVPSPPPM